MQIKDVEKLTGLTKKSIRFYEEEGLLDVKRDKNNDYREYSEEDVRILRQIHLYRFLDFSIEEIRFLQNADPCELKEKIQQRIDEIEKQAIEGELKKDICVRLLKNEPIDVLIDDVDTLNEDNVNTIFNTIMQLSCTSTPAIIVFSLVLTAPVLWLFINIHLRKWDSLYINAVLAILSSLLLVSQWKGYLTFKKHHKDHLKKINRGSRLVIPVALALIVLTLASFILIQLFQNKVLLPSDYLFFEMPQWQMVLLIPVIVLVYLMLTVVVLNHFNIRGMAYYDELLDWLKNRRLVQGIVVAVCLAVVYCGITNINVVCKDRILLIRPYALNGIVYRYEDVQCVDARFKRNGDFFYTLTFADHQAAFNVPNVNPSIERYENDSYLELEEFDKALMDLSIAKVSDDSYADNAMMDQVYIDRFIRICNNRN